MLTADGPRLLECNARLGDPEAQVILPRLAVPLGPLLLDGGAWPARDRRRRADRGPARRGRGDRPRRRNLSRCTRAAAMRSTASTRARATGALVFHAGTRRDGGGGFVTNGGRVLTVVGRGPDQAAARAVGGVGRGCDLVARACSAAATSPRRRRSRPRPWARPMIRRYTLAEMGALWTDQARFEGMLRVELAVARAQAARGLVPPEALAAIEARGHGRSGADRRDREDDRPRRHRLRLPGRRVGRPRGPLPPSRPDEQRRRRHRPRPPAAGRRGAPPPRLRPAPGGARSPAPGRRPRR